MQNKYWLVSIYDQLIIVSNERITEVDKYCLLKGGIKIGDDPNKYDIFDVNKDFIDNYYMRNHVSTFFKVIAGLDKLPSIDLSLLSEADRIKIDWFDINLENKVIVAAQQYALDKCQIDMHSLTKVKNAWKDGFITAHTNNKKLIIDAWMAYVEYRNYKSDEYIKPMIDDFKWFLSTPRMFNIEIELTEDYSNVEEDQGSLWRAYVDYVPKINNDSIKITKIY